MSGLPPTPTVSVPEDPLIELDDHRLQSPSLPRAATSAPRTRRGTFASLQDETLNLDRADDAFHPEGMFARDFEQAIDDNASISSMDRRIQQSSANPGIGRRSTFRRTRPHISRDSSESRGDSPSPPTSVHAFADHTRRRDRANTVDRAPSIELPDVNNGEIAPAHRRGTFSDGREDKEEDEESTATSVENDVCYPQSDIVEGEPSIDFEELEEFVAETAQMLSPRPVSLPETAGETTRVNTEHRAHLVLPSPAILPSEEAFDELEKCDMAPPPSERRPSVVALKRTLWTFFSSEYEDTIHSTSIGGLLNEGETFKQLFNVNQEGGCWWLDILRPSEVEVTAVCKAFGVHPLTREDIATQENREKVELFHNYYFVAFRSFQSSDKTAEDYLEPINVYGVVFRQGVITFSFDQNPHASNVLKRIGKLRDHMQLSADWICYAIIDDIVDTFMPVIGEIESQVDSIEDQVFTARYEDARLVLRAIGESRKKVMSLMRLLGGKYDVIKGFAKRCNENFSVAPHGDVGIYLSDIQDHVVTMRDNLSHSEQLLSRVHNNFLAQINVENITHGNKVNRLLGKVTLVATILVPMNLITGLFGMNVDVPGKNAAGLGWFFGIVGIILAVCVIALLVAKRMRLI